MFYTAKLYNDYTKDGSIDVLDRRPINFNVFLFYFTV